jgi:Flp pilus assembly protein TadG
MRIAASRTFPSPTSSTARSGNRRWGAAVVEFAVVALPFFIIVVGLVEVGRALMVQHLLLAAARQGARVGIVPPNGNTEISTAVGNVMTPAGITSDKITVTVNDGTADASTATTGQEITVQVYVPVGSISWLPFTNYLSGNLSAQYTLRRQ